ncbi:MAG: flavodoxin family protein [Proteobacteria bacterium]|nr:flavodoxin family protein [Pseudomonadota bacterium]
MDSYDNVLGLVGSPNREGRTVKLVSAVLSGAAEKGAPTELVHMSEHVIAACMDCLPYICKDNRKCTYDDKSFEYLSQKILNCGALVLGTPVYWWDTSGMVKYLILKMLRVHALSAPLRGVPAVGIAVAGATGNGLISGLRPLYHLFQIMQMRAIEPLPATRFNFRQATDWAITLGARIAEMTTERTPYDSFEQMLLSYDALPYLGLSRADERHLLADLIVQALPQTADPAIAWRLARADAKAAGGKTLDALIEIGHVCEVGTKEFQE